MSTIEYGAAVRDITPPYPAWQHGYGARLHRSLGVAEPISLGCLALRSGSETVLFVTCDMIGIRTDVCQGLYELLEDEVGLSFPNVMFSCSHTHFAPALHMTDFTSPDIAMVEPDPEYVADFRAKLAEAAHEAMRNMRPAELQLARLAAPQVLFNRRTVKRADGTVQTNYLYPEDPTPYDFSPVDPELCALRLVDETGVKAVLANFGCHPVTGCGEKDDDNYLVSADYPYYLRQAVSEHWGCPVFFTLGGAGDAVPVERRGNCRQRIGEVLGHTITLAERTFAPDPSASVRAATESVQVNTIVKTDAAHAKEKYEDARRQVLALSEETDGAAYSEARAEFARTMQEAFRARLYPENRHTIDVQFVQVGSMTFVGLPFEVLSELGLKMKEACAESVLVSCAGGYQGYLPLQYEYGRGGYEASADSTHFEPGTADRLLEVIIARLGQLCANP